MMTSTTHQEAEEVGAKLQARALSGHPELTHWMTWMTWMVTGDFSGASGGFQCIRRSLG